MGAVRPEWTREKTYDNDMDVMDLYRDFKQKEGYSHDLFVKFKEDTLIGVFNAKEIGYEKPRYPYILKGTQMIVPADESVKIEDLFLYEYRQKQQVIAKLVVKSYDWQQDICFFRDLNEFIKVGEFYDTSVSYVDA